jgi:hypothetical protein
VAAVFAMIVLAVVTGLSVAVFRHFADARLELDAYRIQIQADWLARAGAEAAIDKILANPKEYSGETVSLIPGSEIKVTVKKDGDNVYRIESVARYPVGERGMSVRSVQRAFKRVESGKTIKLEPISSDGK